jgi:hypothetical protein
MIVLFTDFLLHGLYTGHMKAGIPAVRAGDIDWKPERLSASFHGRDLFAPGAPYAVAWRAAAWSAAQRWPDRRVDWPDARNRRRDWIIRMTPQPEPSTQEVLAVLVERVTYHNAENVFFAFCAPERACIMTS